MKLTIRTNPEIIIEIDEEKPFVEEAIVGKSARLSESLKQTSRGMPTESCSGGA